MNNTPDFFVVVHPDPRFQGRVTFKAAKVFDRVAIASRTAQLRNEIRPDAFNPRENALFSVIATLEFVITNAPEGFYLDEKGKKPIGESPILNLAHVDEDTLTEVFLAWQAFDRFHSYPKRRIAETLQATASPSDLDSRDPDQPEPI